MWSVKRREWMLLRREWMLFLFLIAGGLPAAHAQFAVIDVASVTQLISEVQTLEQQLATAREHLAQAQAEYQSITGGRGMEQLLAGTVRNYLPADWNAVAAAAQGGGTYPALASAIRDAVNANAVLSVQDLASLSPTGSEHLRTSRQTVATLQAVAHQALATSSSRFASLQQLIDAIARAPDQKAVLDLQARVAAEQGMLVNEQIKLQMLYQSIEANRWAEDQRSLERVIAGQGQFATRFQPTP